MSKIVGISPKEVGDIMALSDEGAIGTFGQNKIIILYNSDIDQKMIERIRFTLAHELGHFILEHPFSTDNSVLSRNGITEQENDCFEIEANNFAKEFLSPSFVVNALKDFSIKNIANSFEISLSSSELSFKYILECRNSEWKRNWLSPPSFFRNNLEEINIKKRINHIGRVGFCNSGNTLMFETRKILFCSICKSMRSFVSTQDDLQYCPCCSNYDINIIDNNTYFKFHETEEQNIMNYVSLNVDEEGKLIQDCPICNNPNIRDNFCSVCGVDIVNRCSGTREVFYEDETSVWQQFDPCEGSLLGGDRYCPKCGGSSTFFVNNLLKKWDQPKINFNVDSFNSNNIDISDDDLPF